MKEIKYSSYKPVFRETFNSEQEVLKNGGKINNVEFDNGNAIFTNGYIEYDEHHVDRITIRIRGNFANINECYLIAGAATYIIYYSPNSNKIYLKDKTNVSKFFNYTPSGEVEELVFVASNSGTYFYINGELSSSATFISGFAFKAIGNGYNVNRRMSGTLDLVEIYNRGLTASEVKNLYNNTWNKEQSFGGDMLIDFDSTQGSLKDNTIGGIIGDNIMPTGWSGWHSTLAVDNGEYTMIQNDAGYTRIGMYKSDSVNFPIGREYIITFKAKSDNITSTMGVNNASSYTFTMKSNPNITTEYQEYIAVGVQTANTYIEFHATDTNIPVGTKLYMKDIVIKQVRPELNAINVVVKKTGSNYGAEFNGTTSKIDLGTDMIGTKAITVMGWIKARSWLEGGYNSAFLTNGSFRFLNYASSIGLSPAPIAVASDGGSFKQSGADVKLNEFNFISLTREKDGTINFYIGDINNAPTQSGSVNQNSGTPTAGTTNVIIGNSSIANRTFTGQIPIMKVVEGVLDIDSIAQVRSETRKYLD